MQPLYTEEPPPSTIPAASSAPFYGPMATSAQPTGDVWNNHAVDVRWLEQQEKKKKEEVRHVYDWWFSFASGFYIVPAVFSLVLALMANSVVPSPMLGWVLLASSAALGYLIATYEKNKHLNRAKQVISGGRDAFRLVRVWLPAILLLSGLAFDEIKMPAFAEAPISYSLLIGIALSYGALKAYNQDKDSSKHMNIVGNVVDGAYNAAFIGFCAYFLANQLTGGAFAPGLAYTMGLIAFTAVFSAWAGYAKHLEKEAQANPALLAHRGKHFIRLSWPILRNMLAAQRYFVMGALYITVFGFGHSSTALTVAIIGLGILYSLVHAAHTYYKTCQSINQERIQSLDKQPINMTLESCQEDNALKTTAKIPVSPTAFFAPKKEPVSLTLSPEKLAFLVLFAYANATDDIQKMQAAPLLLLSSVTADPLVGKSNDLAELHEFNDVHCSPVMC